MGTVHRRFIDSSSGEQLFTATPGQTAFTITNFTPTSRTLVFIDGVQQNTGFTLAGQIFTFAAMIGGEQVKFKN